MSIPLRALVIDDSEDDVELLVRRLRRNGYDPITHRRVGSLPCLLKTLEEDRRWDLVMCDCSVPGLGPMGVLSLLQSRSIDLPLIVWSGALPPEMASELIRAGAAGCATKDDPPHLFELLGNLVGTVEARQRARAIPAGSGDLKQLFLLAQDMLCVAGLDGYFKLVNPAFERTLGFPREELLAKPFMSFVHPDDRQRTTDEMRTLTSGVPTLAFQNRYLCADGSYKWLAWTSQPAVTEGLVYATARDVTEAVRLTEELRTATRELEAFSYSVSHDLRAPLRAIAGFTEILIEDYGPELSREARDLLERVSVGAGRMGTLIEQLLVLARAPSHPLRVVSIDLSGIARQIVGRLQEAEPERSVDFVCPEKMDAEADPQLCEVLLENLLGNAWKYTRKTLSPRIELGCADQDDHRVYFVRDNGVGFDMESAGQLFQPFGRLHHSEKFEGTGIGLATVRRIVMRHGGQIWAEGKVDQGAVFYFALGT